MTKERIDKIIKAVPEPTLNFVLGGISLLEANARIEIAIGYVEKNQYEVIRSAKGALIKEIYGDVGVKIGGYSFQNIDEVIEYILVRLEEKRNLKKDIRFALTCDDEALISEF